MSRLYEDFVRSLLGGVSCMCASTATNPVEVVKTRMQLENELSELERQKGLRVFNDRYYNGLLRGALRVVSDEGLLALYKGLPPSLIREITYSSIRLGAYEPLKHLFSSDPYHTYLGIKILAGAISGSLGSVVAIPADVVRIRFQGEGKLLPGQKPRYKNTLQAFIEIGTTEGVRGLYRGIGPTVQRAAVLSATQIPVYDHTKYIIITHGWMAENFYLHIVASMISGLATAFTTSPVDLVKTRVMNQKVKGSDGLLYKNGFDCFIKSVRSEGFLSLYKGFIPNWMRLGPHTIITFIVYEKLRYWTNFDPI